MILPTEANDRLAFFRHLYEQARAALADTFADFDRHMRQYRGDKQIDGSEEPALTVRNITYELIESQICSDIPLPKVDADCYSEARDRNAKSIERLLSSLRDRLPFETINDMDERYTYIYGGSIFYVEWDKDAGPGGEGGVLIHSISPRDFIPQPAITSIADMDYCFLRFTTTLSELSRKYGIPTEELSGAEAEYDACAAELSEGATVLLCFYKDEQGRIGSFAFSGDLTLTDIPDFYRRKVRVCTRCRLPEGECQCKSPRFRLQNQPEELLVHRITQENGRLREHFFRPEEEKEGMEEALLQKRVTVPYYTPGLFPIVIRKNTSGEHCLLGQSDCEFLRPEQQAINKIESRILQKLLRSGVTPVVPEDATVTLNNAVFGQVIRTKPGESMNRYGTVDTTPDISQDIAEAERLYQNAKRILGISDAYQGMTRSATESGYAKRLQIEQSSGRLESKRKMKHTAYADMDRLIFSFYLAFSDEPKPLSYRDAYGRIHNASFHRLDFIFYDERRGCYRYDDGYLFSVDLNGGTEGRRQELWERNLENLRSGALGDPTSPMTLLRYWQCQERAHYPFARENVEYFTSALEQATEKEESHGTQPDGIFE